MVMFSACSQLVKTFSDLDAEEAITSTLRDVSRAHYQQ